MIVCICHNVTEEQIIHEIDRGADSIPILACKLGVTTTCGSCESEVQSIIDKHKRNKIFLPFIKIDFSS